jgi:hypothetical protein
VSKQPIEWVFRPSVTELFCLLIGEFLVFWYAWLIDDAYVYFRYVDNLVIHGQGLVWNPGEYVEGFSSPLWGLFLSALRALYLNYWDLVRVVGMLAFSLFWWLACLVNRGFTSRDEQPQVALNVPLIYLSLTYGVLCYFTSGLESPFVSIVAVAYVAAVLWPFNSFFQVLVGISPLVRHELTLPFMLFITYVLVVNKRAPFSAIIAFTLSVGSYGLFRIWYYADLFPNTFYLKDTTWYIQGLKYVYDTVLPYQTIPYLLSMLILYVVVRKNQPDCSLLTRERLMILLLAFSVGIYVVRIGGDPRHFRYLVFPFILTILATGGVLEMALREWNINVNTYSTTALAVFGLAIACNYPRQLQQHPLFRSHFDYGHHGFLSINDAAAHRFHFTPPWWSHGDDLSYRAAEQRYEREISALNTPSGEQSGGGSRSDIPFRVVADELCRPAYLHPAISTIHSLGLTDPFLARTEMRADRPAHKYGLKGLAEDLLVIRRKYGFRRGAFDSATQDSPSTPRWIAVNIRILREIELKAYNRHDLVENVSRAFSRIPTVDPGSSPKGGG